MKYTRNHAPILGVLSASGLQIYPTSHQSDSQSTLGDEMEDEDQWMQQRDKSLDRMHAKRERRRRGTNRSEGWNEEDVVAAPDYESDSGTASASGSWELSPKRAAGSDPSERMERAESEHLRSTGLTRAPRRTPRRPTRRHVSNPDHGDEDYGYDQEKEVEWRSGSTNALSHGGRYRNDEAYMLTHDALAYSFGSR